MSLTLTTPATDLMLATGEDTVDFAVTGTLHDGFWNLFPQKVTLSWYAGEGCTDFVDSDVYTAATTNGTFSDVFSASDTVSFRATWSLFGHTLKTSNCLTVTIDETPVPAAPTYVPGVVPDSYLCWNHEMTNPVAYPDNVADTMWATGNYFEPQAILGNVAGGTNLGAYHLVCNAPSTMTETDQAIGGSGEVYDAAAVAAFHHDHPVNGNDLNIYHIWK